MRDVLRRAGRRPEGYALAGFELDAGTAIHVASVHTLITDPGAVAQLRELGVGVVVADAAAASESALRDD